MSVSACSASSASSTVLYIKHMVCPRGIRVVRQKLEQLGLVVLDVRLGAATVAASAEELDWPRIRAVLRQAEFALLENAPQALLERVKEAVGQLLRQPAGLRHREFLAAVAEELHLPAAHLNVVFARLSPGATLAGYILGQRLAYAQELLASSKLGIGHIARQLGYSSLAHFSGQFRRVARCSPSTYRQRLGAPKQPVAVGVAVEVPNDAS
ncbi:helix-turn-helix transcriptional regulator [Hymenobacter roseosalivarius]|nr:AraC family transcriptional regulator [Hymenobacter roseosalivarius]